MSNSPRPISRSNGYAVVTAWSMPAVVTAAMVCPPALIVAPALVCGAALRGRHKRKARLAAEQEYRDRTWGGWAG